MNMLDQLGIDQSFFYQLGISAFYFIVFTTLLLGKLQKVIFEREERTTLLESKAEGMFERVNNLSEKYNSKVKEASLEAQKNFNDKKTHINSEANKRFEAAEASVEKLYLEQKSKLVQEVAELEKNLLSSSSDVEATLLGKLS